MTKHNFAATYIRFALVAIVCLLNSPHLLAMTVNSAVAVGPQLTITGTGFNGTPVSVTFNGSQITVTSSTSTQIVATINPLPPPGTYRVVVKVGTASSGAVYVTLSNVIAKVSLLNQTAAIPPTTLWTPVSDGLYRVSIYLVQVPPLPPAGTASGNLNLEFQWTDDAGIQAQFGSSANQYSVITIQSMNLCGPTGTCQEFLLGPGAASLQGIPGAVYILRVKAGSPIQYTMVFPDFLNGLMYYDLFITLEQI